MKSERNTYPQPPHGWTCYHCGETFTVWGAAEDHFGKTPQQKPGCLLKVQYGDEMGLLMELRKSEAHANDLLNRARDAEREAETLACQLAAFTEIAPNANDLRMKLDSMQGRVVTANALIEGFRQRDAAAFSEIIG